jgi:hypothetical protein
MHPFSPLLLSAHGSRSPHCQTGVQVDSDSDSERVVDSRPRLASHAMYSCKDHPDGGCSGLRIGLTDLS